MLRRFLTIALFAVSALHAQPGSISTIVGGYPLGDGLPATRALVNDILSVAPDADGGVLIGEPFRIRRVAPDGRISTVMGNGIWGGPPVPFAGTLKIKPGEGNFSWRIAGSASGAIYVGMNIFCWTGGSWLPTGAIVRLERPEDLTMVLGSGPCAPSFADGIPASSAFTTRIDYLRVDAQNRVYFSDSQLNRVRRIDPDGKVFTVAGSGVAGFAGDGGPAVRAELRNPQSFSIAPDGVTVYIADFGNGRIRKVDADGIITTFAEVPNIRHVVASRTGDVIAADFASVWRYSADGSTRTQIVRPSPRFDIRELVEDRDGTLLVAHPVLVYRLNPDGSDAAHVAGVDINAGSSGPMEFARTLYPDRTRFDSTGALWFKDSLGIRKQTAQNTLETVLAYLPVTFVIAPDSTVYLLNNDSIDKIVDGRRVRHIAPEKLNTTSLFDMAANEAGDLFVADRQNHRVLRVGLDGEPKVAIGNGKQEHSGDGGPGDAAGLNTPWAVAFGPDGSLFVGGQGAIRRLSPEGLMSTVVGGPGPCRQLEAGPARDYGNCIYSSITAGKRGELYFRIEEGGAFYRLRGQNVARIAGQPLIGFGGDGGPALQARLYGAFGPSVAPNGDLVFADRGNHRIRRVQGFTPFTLSTDRVVFASSLGGVEQTERIQVSASDGETRAFRAEILYPAGRQGWLRVTPTNGSVGRDLAASLSIIANPRGLPKGIYSARVRLVDTQTEDWNEIAVTLLVSGTAQQLRLGQTGFTFVTAQGGPAPPAQSLTVQNSGSGVMPFTVAVSTLSGGAWLSATPNAGTADATTQPAVSVRANAANLAPGVYFGLVTVNSTAADNAPQSAVVLLQVLATGQEPSPIVDPAGLLFTSTTPQSITLGNARQATISYTISPPTFPDRRAWFQLPAAALSGNILPGQTARIEIRPQTAEIPPGQYRAQLSVRFAPGGETRIVELLLVVANTSGASAKGNAAGTCRPTKLLPMFQQPGGGFTATAGWPQPVQLRVADDCQELLTKGRVRVTFNNGDPPLTLVPQGDGVWTGTWAPGRVATRIDLSVRAESFDPDLTGAQTVSGGLRDDANRPRIAPGGVWNDASQKRLDPLAVGSGVIVQGARLAASASTAPENSTILPTRLGDTVVLVAGKPLGLAVAGAGEVKGVIPYSVADATVQQMIVQRGASYSLPEPVLIAPVQPAVYSADGTGRGQGAVYVKSDDQQVLADAARPVAPGEEVTIFATGLGAVDPKVADGSAGLGDPISNVLAAVRVQIQGRDAVVKSATLVPGKHGQYAVVAVVPEGVVADGVAKVVITAADQAVSAPVTIAVIPTVRP